MPLETLVDRPLLGAADGQPEEFESPPISRLAIVAFVFGLLSPLATLGSALLPVAIVAIALGLLVYWKLSRDPSHSGKTLAMAGLGLGILFAAWTLSANFLRNQYMYQASQSIAEHFLNELSKDHRYDAYELTRPEAERQIAGTSLQRFYESSGDPETRSGFREFVDQEGTKLVLSRGAGAKWKFVRGVEVSHSAGGKTQVAVELVDNSQQPEARLTVHLNRDASSVNPEMSKGPTATWYVRSFAK